MNIAVGKITDAVAKITAITSGDKIIPGILLRVSNDPKPELAVCYTDGHKAIVEYLDVELDDTDKTGDFVVDYTMFTRALQNCQPSGIIAVDTVSITHKDDRTLQVSAEQKMITRDSEGNAVGEKVMAVKKMDVHWDTLDSSAKTAVLSRMDYASIFNTEDTEGNEIVFDVLTKNELVTALNKVTTEKGRIVYFSKNQMIFTVNQAHTTVVPIEKVKLTDDDLNTIRGQLVEADQFTDENFKNAIKAAESRIHQAIMMPPNIAKSLIAILGKTSSETLYMHRDGDYITLFTESEDQSEKVGIWFESAKGSKAQTGVFQKFLSINYNTYQVRFITEFLVNNINGVLSSTKDTDIKLQFKHNDEGELALYIEAGSAGKSISDSFSVLVDDIIDPTNDIESKQFEISIKVLDDMLSQIKTPRVAIDFGETGDIIDADGNTVQSSKKMHVRISEINEEKLASEYTKAREETARLCQAQNITFDPNATPTPVELKLAMRENCIETQQYTMLK